MTRKMDAQTHDEMLAAATFIQTALEREMGNRDGKTSNLDNEINAVIAAANEWAETHRVAAMPDLGVATADDQSATGADWSRKFALYTAQWLYMGRRRPGYPDRV